MSLSVQLGLLLALATTFTSVVGFLYKHRGAVESPTVEMRRPVRSSLVLFKSRWYTLGILSPWARGRSTSPPCPWRRSRWSNR